MLAVVQESDLDRGAASVARDTKRTCALTREVKPIAELLRFVVGPSGEAVADVKRKLPGRGIWITSTRAAVENAARQNIFARGFRREVQVCPDLADKAESLIEQAALDALAIAYKAGLVLTGFSKVQGAIGRDDLQALIHARDSGDEGRRKLSALLQRNTGGKSREITVIDDFTGAQLDLALSRLNVVHAALLAGPGSGTFLTRFARLRRFRTGFSPDAVSAYAPTDGA